MIFAGGDPRGITRRDVMAGGAVALAAGLLRGPAAFAAPVAEVAPVSWRHTVTPATTNLTAVLGAFPRGPVNQAVLVTSWDDFAAQFGAPAIPPFGNAPSMAVYAVWQLFYNGGIGAWIVRLDAPGSTIAQATYGPLTLRADDEGAWASGLRVAFRPASSGTPDHLDFTVSAPDSSSGQAGAVLETLVNLPNDATLATGITSQSQYLSATAQGTDPLVPQSQDVRLAGGADGAWSVASFASAVLAQLGEDGSSSAPTPALDQIAPQVFNLMCIPDLVYLSTTAQGSAIAAAHRYCQRHNSFLIADPPPPASAMADAWLPDTQATSIDSVGTAAGMASLNQWGAQVLSPEHVAAATYYPWPRIPDPFNDGATRLVPPSGTIAGVYATTDVNTGVWKAPAGIKAVLTGVTALADLTIDDTVNGTLNTQGINCLRTFPGAGNVVWGARTLAGGDLLQSNFKYVSVRRLTSFVEQSLQESLKWATFEPNDAQLWSWLTIEVSAFMAMLYGSGAFQGASAAAAYQVVCDASTTTPADMQSGIVNVSVGFRPVDPAEFVALTVTVAASSPAT
ncbi:MAG: phage tail sheath family protein [Solirubrobacteraceae bacterium]